MSNTWNNGNSAKDSPSRSAPSGADPAYDALVATVLGGDLKAYRQIVERCEAKVRVILAAMLPDREGVEDLAQEVFVTTYAKLRDYRPGTDFEAWIKAITRNLALNERRRWLRYEGFKQKFQAEMETVLDPLVTEATGRFEGHVIEALRDCLGQLRDHARRITEDFYYRGHKTDLIAQNLNRTAGWVRLTLFRARAALADCLHLKRVM
ncbi:MAG: sigma-70 family RNA polymerase sigma factor [Verrucomicrobia bacterium]|nr:sigma-70 family RNA polymerase sigma factor [Verrucomicrobiota bacterium]